MPSSFALSLLALTLLSPCQHAQVPIPISPPGFTYGKGSANAHIQLDVFVDLLCPDSKAAYPALQEVAAKLSSNIFLLRFHQFPLPYHRNAFPIAQASETIAHALGKDKFTRWMETVYKVQDSYWNKVTEDMGQTQVTEKIRQLAMTTFPELSDTAWREGMTGHGGTERDSDTRTAWKYACTRGISGTPMFLLNQVPIDADASFTFHDWMKRLKPLLKANAVAQERFVERSSRPMEPPNAVIVPVEPIALDQVSSFVSVVNGLHVVLYVGAGTVLGVAVLLTIQRYRSDYRLLR